MTGALHDTGINCGACRGRIYEDNHGNAGCYACEHPTLPAPKPRNVKAVNYWMRGHR